VEGPWTVYDPGVLGLESSFFIDHVASPDIHVDDRRREIRMYFHGMVAREGYVQGTRVATSEDGIHFSVRPAILGDAYLRAFPWKGLWYAMAMPGQFYRSVDGLSDFEPGPRLFSDAMRHAALACRDDTLTVFYTNVGDCPEAILVSAIDLRPDWREWTASRPRLLLEPEVDYEGADLALKPSTQGPADHRVRELRDPFVYHEDRRAWLFYAVAGESGIAVARLAPDICR
jgi:hypothetical protein